MMQQRTMRAMQQTAYGDPDVLQLVKKGIPTARRGEILVRVEAAAATAADSILRKGKPYFSRLFIGLRRPKKAITGTGFSGVVEATGPGVKHFQQGDKVFGETLFAFGAHAEYLVVNEDGVVMPMPQGMSFAEAAVYCDGHLTSLNFLQEVAQTKRGERVLINGAAGSLGTSAIQLAKWMGAEVTAVCSTRNVGLVKGLGADHVIDYTREDFTKSYGSFDVIYDTVGKSSYRACKKALRVNGRFVTPVFSFSLLPNLFLNPSRVRFAATGMKKVQELRELLQQLLEIYQEGKLQTLIDRQFPLEKLSEAHRLIDAGHKRGNVVLQMC